MFSLFRLKTLFACAALAPAATIEILSVEPTVLFPKQEPLRQIAWVQAVNRSAQPVACEVRVQLEGEDTGDREKVTLTPGVTRVRALVPDLSSPRSVTVSLVESGGNVLASREQSWQPQRHWKASARRLGWPPADPLRARAGHHAGALTATLEGGNHHARGERTRV